MKDNFGAFLIGKSTFHAFIKIYALSKNVLSDETLSNIKPNLYILSMNILRSVEIPNYFNSQL